MSLTYSTYVTELAALCAYAEDNTDFTTFLPSAIDYAEQRIYRELDMIVEDIADSSSSTTALNRNFTLPTAIGTFQVISGINIITPASTAPAAGTRNQLQPVSRDFLDFSYPSTTAAGVPQYFAYFTQSSVAGQSNIILGPWPDTTYVVEVIGKIIPTPLSASNTTTFLTLYLPDLFLAASMVFMAGAMKNYGAQADDPRNATSWETQYQALRESAGSWEARKRFAGASWSSKQPEPTAVPQRG